MTNQKEEEEDDDDVEEKEKSMKSPNSQVQENAQNKVGSDIASKQKKKWPNPR